MPNGMSYPTLSQNSAHPPMPLPPPFPDSDHPLNMRNSMPLWVPRPPQVFGGGSSMRQGVPTWMPIPHPNPNAGVVNMGNMLPQPPNFFTGRQMRSMMSNWIPHPPPHPPSFFSGCSAPHMGNGMPNGMAHPCRDSKDVVPPNMHLGMPNGTIVLPPPCTNGDNAQPCFFGTVSAGMTEPSSAEMTPSSASEEDAEGSGTRRTQSHVHSLAPRTVLGPVSAPKPTTPRITIPEHAVAEISDVPVIDSAPLPFSSTDDGDDEDVQVGDDGFYHCTLHHHWAVRQETKFRQLKELRGHMTSCHNIISSSRAEDQHICPHSDCDRSISGNGFVSERALSVHLSTHRLNSNTEVLYFLPAAEQQQQQQQPRQLQPHPRRPFLDLLRFNAPGRERPEMLHHNWTLGEWTLCATRKPQRYTRGNIVAALYWPTSGSGSREADSDSEPDPVPNPVHHHHHHHHHPPYIYQLPPRLSFAGTSRILLQDTFTFVYLDDNRLYIFPHPSSPGGFEALLETPTPLPVWWDVVPHFDDPQPQPHPQPQPREGANRSADVHIALGKAIQDLTTREMSRLWMSASLGVPATISPSYRAAFELLRRRRTGRCGVTRTTTTATVRGGAGAGSHSGSHGTGRVAGGGTTEFGEMTSFELRDDLGCCRIRFHFYSVVLTSVEMFVSSLGNLLDYGIAFHDPND